MSAEKKVLLARPHSFIVSDMKPFLEKSGFLPVRLDALSALDSGISGTMSGAVISTAVLSTINASAEEVFSALRKKYPRLPVIFAGLTEFSMMKSAVERVVGRLHPGAEVRPFSGTSENYPGLGRENVFLVLRKEDMAPGPAAEAAERVLRKHFRQA
jgi:hypothetical protein